MDKKERLIIELKKENKNLKQHLKDSERWEDYWKHKIVNLERSCLFWKHFFFANLIGTILASLILYL